MGKTKKAAKKKAKAKKKKAVERKKSSKMKPKVLALTTTSKVSSNADEGNTEETENDTRSHVDDNLDQANDGDEKTQFGTNEPGDIF